MESDVLLIPATFIATLIGLGLVVHLVKQREFYTAIFFSSHLAMCVFIVYILRVADRVYQLPEFDFSVFTTQNLRTAVIAIAVALGLIATICYLCGNQSSDVQPLNVSHSFRQLFGKIASLRGVHILGLVAISFVSALVLYMCGTSVLEVPYALNLEDIAYPVHLLIIPPFLALLALMAFHSRVLLRGSFYQDPLLVLLTRTNLVISSVLILLTYGARGYVTFICALASLTEFYSARKRRAIPMWGLIFGFSTYFLDTVWPFLRGNLWVMNTSDALRTALEIAMRSSEDMSEASPGLVNLYSYPLICVSLFHLLYVIQLEDQGISLAGSTFFNLFPQALPSFLDGILWDRPLNDNWVLAEYYAHGGGFLCYRQCVLEWRNGGDGCLRGLFIRYFSVFRSSHG